MKLRIPPTPPRPKPRIQRVRDESLRIVGDPNNKDLFDDETQPFNVLILELLQKFTVKELCERSEEFKALHEESLLKNKSGKGLNNDLRQLKDEITDVNKPFRKHADRLTAKKERAMAGNGGDKTDLNTVRANLFDDAGVAGDARANHPAVTPAPGPERVATTNATSDNASLDALTETVTAGFSNVTAEFSNIAEKLERQGEKVDVANYKADKNAEELKAIIPVVHSHTQQLVVLHRNDASREVELRQLKQQASQPKLWAVLAAVVGCLLFLLFFLNDGASAFAGVMV